MWVVVWVLRMGVRGQGCRPKEVVFGLSLSIKVSEFTLKGQPSLKYVDMNI